MKNWIIVFGTEKFHVTEEEARFYTESLEKGKKFVLLKNGMMLSDKALYVTPEAVVEESKKLAEGKWQCPQGKWHTQGWGCSCNLTPLIEE